MSRPTTMRAAPIRVREQVGTGREQLAELDVGRPKLLEREPEPAGAFTCGGPVADDADLAEHAQKSAAPRNSSDVQRAFQPLDPRAHRRG